MRGFFSTAETQREPAPLYRASPRKGTKEPEKPPRPPRLCGQRTLSDRLLSVGLGCFVHRLAMAIDQDAGADDDERCSDNLRRA